MSRPAVTVHLATTVTRAARLMLDEHIHRVVGVDDEGAPVGVLTTSDLLRLLLPEEDAHALYRES
jgi:CBS domain-containing protein